MPSLQTISSCLQQLVESPTSRRRARRSKRQQKSSKTSTIYSPFSPRIAFLEPIDYDRDTTPLLNASRSNTPSMLSAITTTLTSTPSILSSVSFAKSETYLPVLPALPFPPHPEIARSNCEHHSEARPFLNVPEAVSHQLDLSAEVFKLSEYAVDKEAAGAIVPKSPILDPNLTEWGENSKSSGPTAYGSLSNYPSSPPGSKVEKDEHEIYLNNLRLLHFGGITESTTGVGDNFLSDGFSLVQKGDDDDASWEEIDLRNYGWQV